MILYKFRPLTNDKDDLTWTKDILELGRFRCSPFARLNDPMEGVFKCLSRDLDGIYGMKNQYRICSFSGTRAFSNPVMWGHYAGGFLGMAVEITVRRNEVKRVKYVKHIKTLQGEVTSDNLVEVLTTKLIPWKQEAEYRFLEKTNEDYWRIGQITKVYFGDPYGNVDNANDIFKDCQYLPDYRNRRNTLIEISGGIPCYSVRIKGYRVIIGEHLNRRRLYNIKALL